MAPAARARDREAEGGDGTGPHRRCFLTGEVRPKSELVRFVVGPDGRIVPDVAGRLPGRGLWLTARRDIVAAAVAKRQFARAARTSVGVADDLADCVEALLARRCCDLLGLARRAGEAVAGFAKVEAALASGEVAVLVAASDGAADGRGKLRARAPACPLVDCLTSAELAVAFGREHVVHAALMPGRLAASFVAEAGRLAGFRATRMDKGSGVAGRVHKESNGTGSR